MTHFMSLSVRFLRLQKYLIRGKNISVPQNMTYSYAGGRFSQRKLSMCSGMISSWHASATRYLWFPTRKIWYLVCILAPSRPGLQAGQGKTKNVT